MRKTCLVLIFILAGISIFAQQAVIRELAGTVEIKRPGSDVWEPARQGQIVEVESMISTSFRSTVVIALENSVLTVRPLSRLSIIEISRQYDAERVELNLQNGRVKADITPQTGVRTEFMVRSSSATSSVRGTSFEFDTRNLYVYEGTVSFKGIHGQAVSIPAGYYVGIGESNSVINPISAGSSSHMPNSPGGGESSPGSIAGAARGGEGPGEPSVPNTPSSPSGPGGLGGPSGSTPNSDPDIPEINIAW